jgi:uncharacterized protein GlcG (DUF336 family)
MSMMTVRRFFLTSCRLGRIALGAWTAIFGFAAGLAVAQELPTEKVLTQSLAVEAAHAALASCERLGYRVSAAVVDRDGVIIALLRGDGAGPHTIDSSSRKAYTAASMGRPTAELAKLVAGNPALDGLRQMNEKILILGGGLPVKAGENLIGGIGVGGAPGADKDEACAAAGLFKIKESLK